MFALNEKPDVVIVEEFGRHNDELGKEDEGFRLISLVERKVMSVSMELDVVQSYSRGLTTAKHIVHIAEKSQLNGQESTGNIAIITLIGTLHILICQHVYHILPLFNCCQLFLITYINLKNYC
tara:strand:+ start:738 stop:1106 length:369 start_codon:yes stop_codon:yes gene_type:complete